jgi:hypothetical protein
MVRILIGYANRTRGGRSAGAARGYQISGKFRKCQFFILLVFLFLMDGQGWALRNQNPL